MENEKDNDENLVHYMVEPEVRTQSWDEVHTAMIKLEKQQRG